MKKLIFLVIIFSSTSLFAQVNSNWKDMGLKGRVKSVTLLENYRYKKDGVNFTEWEILYNKKYLFDNTGRYTHFTEYKQDGNVSYMIKYVYNAKEKKAEVIYLDKDETPTTKYIWLYNTKNQKTEEQQYTKEGQLSRRYTYGYNDKGIMTEMTGYKPDGKMTSKTTWTIDANGNTSGYLLETPGYANSSRKFLYDDKGNKKEETWHNGKGEIDFRIVRKYDPYGNMTEEATYKGENDFRHKTTWKYEYDKTGNWIKKNTVYQRWY